MSKTRRFRVDSLAGMSAGARVILPPAEARHAGVLRLKSGAELQLFDAEGRHGAASLHADRASAVLREAVSEPRRRSSESVAGLVLATAWPKGKRAALLIEKCTELGVAEIIPLRCTRSVVVKDAESEGWARLQRIADEAAKQCGRTQAPRLSPERSFAQLLADRAQDSKVVLLDPGAPRTLLEVLQEAGSTMAAAADESLVCLVGPEGGFTEEERALAEQAGVERARIGHLTLRVETAAMAACAACAAWQDL